LAVGIQPQPDLTTAALHGRGQRTLQHSNPGMVQAQIQSRYQCRIERALWSSSISFSM
jgi:hypothetical protein